MISPKIAVGRSDYEWPRKRIGRYAEGVRIGQWLIVEVVRVDDKTQVRTKCTLCGYYDRHPLDQHTKSMSKVCVGCEDKIARAEVAQLWAACGDDGILPEERCRVCGKPVPDKTGGRTLCSKLCRGRSNAAAQGARYRAALEAAKKQEGK